MPAMFSPACRASSRPMRSRARSGGAAAGRELIDLTISNPTRAGIAYPEALFAPLASADVVRLRPEPFGSATRPAGGRRRLRAAVASATTADRIVLTASTSEAYSLLFKLLCAPAGDAVLVPVPSYPLFEHLTAPRRRRGSGLRASTTTAAGGSTSRASIACGRARRARCSRSARTTPPARCSAPRRSRALAERCAARDAALILDEVFADYPLEPIALELPSRPLGGHAVPDLQARRPVQVGGAAAGEARMDCGRRPGPRWSTKRWRGSSSSATPTSRSRRRCRSPRRT